MKDKKEKKSLHKKLIDLQQKVKNNLIKEEKQKGIKFYKKVWYSITNVRKYPDMAKEGAVKANNYFFILVTIFAILLSLLSFSEILVNQNEQMQVPIFNYLIELFIIYFIEWFIVFIFFILIYWIIAFLTTKILKLKIKFMEIFSMVVYSFTLTVILFGVYMVIYYFTQITIPYLMDAFVLIPFVYLILTFFKMKNNKKVEGK